MLFVRPPFPLSKRKGRLQVGLLDADVFGPSIPTMMNLDESPQLDDEDFMLPLNNFGLKVRIEPDLTEC